MFSNIIKKDNNCLNCKKETQSAIFIRSKFVIPLEKIQIFLYNYDTKIITR